MSETPEKNSPVQKSISESNSPIWEKAAHPFPIWRKAVFGIALLLGFSGLGLQVAETTDKTAGQAGQVRMSANVSESADASNARLAPQAFRAQAPAATDSPGTQASKAAVSSPSGQTISGGLREKLDTPLGQYLNDWSAPMMQLGFSFVAGFSMGYALAFFLKATALIIGVLLFVLFGLQYAGLADVNWLGIQGYYDSFITWAQPHAGSFQDFIMSNLPVSGMVALGIFTGFRKK